MTLAPSIREINPFGIGIEEVWLLKFDRSDRLNILPQFVEISIFQNIFTSTVSAEMLVYDPIGLFTNYPLTGEESIVFVTKPQLGRSTPENSDITATKFPFGSSPLSSIEARTFRFKITGIRDITPTDNAREASYILELASEEIFESMRCRVSHCYTEQSVSKSAQDLFFQYVTLETRQRLETDGFGAVIKNFFVDEDAAQAVPMHVIIPNLNPLIGIEYLRKKAACSNSEKYHTWVFFENFYGHFFTTIQSIIEDQITNFGDSIRDKKYVYNSNFELTNQSLDPTAINRLISRYDVSKRFSSSEKIVSGYYRNQTITINPETKDYPYYEYTDEDENQEGYLYRNKFNTVEYRRELASPYAAPPLNNKEFENAPRLVYKIETGNKFMLENEDVLKRIRDSRSNRYLASLNQVDITIVVPGDLTHNVGEVIYVDFPELHGFNKVERDKYISGYYLVTEIRHTITTGGKASTVLRINKDSLAEELDTNMLYDVGNDVPVRSERVIDPATGFEEQ